MNRRELLHRSGLVALAPFLLNRSHAAATVQALEPVVDLETELELLKLPAGFTYRSMSWTGDMQSTGTGVPDRHDGMGLVKGSNPEETVLLRNHERYYGAAITGEGVSTYDSFKAPPGLSRRVGSPFGVAGPGSLA